MHCFLCEVGFTLVPDSKLQDSKLLAKHGLEHFHGLRCKLHIRLFSWNENISI